MNESQLPPEARVINISSLIPTKTIASANVARPGSTFVIELVFSDASTCFIKTYNGRIEIGGTADTGTGTEITW
ncbi:MAG TPA: hypothetical protein VHB45_07565 [Alloacidobacterium sp.]|nr:hypothetical protein [Alloacidobacterium sp.]